MRPVRLLLPAALLALLVAPATAAALEVVPGSATTEMLDRAGNPTSLAGAHPDRLITSFALEQGSGPEEHLREAVMEMPAGLAGDLKGFPACPRALFSEGFGEESPCPAETQVGVETIEESSGTQQVPVYNLEPGPNELAAFGTQLGIPVTLFGRLGQGQSLSLVIEDLPSQQATISSFKIELWGVPADHQKGGPYPRRPFLTTPTSCGEPLRSRITVRTFERPDEAVVRNSDAAPVTGCAGLPFDPSVSFTLDNPVADAPSGGHVDILVPQSGDPDGRVSSQVRTVAVTLPQGLSIAPGAAAGLLACSDAQFGLGSDSEVGCPARSRIGSIEMTGPALSRPMVGTMYIGQERPDDRFRLFVAAAAPGSTLKFTASLHADPRSGQLTTDLADLPQVAFERMTLSFDGGPGALLATPISCGTATASARLTPYSGGPVADSSAPVAIRSHDGSPCAGAAPFSPLVSAGGDDVRAGRGGGFTTTLRRADGEQVAERISVAFPPGVSANLGAIALCPSPLAAVGACAAASRIGEADAEIGPGANPVRLRGDVFVTGAYRRSPFGIAIVLPARLGPFDLGKLVVRGTMQMDPLSGQVALVTDPLSRAVEGVGVRFETIQLRIDRPGFMRNPTACEPRSVETTVTSATGAVARVSTPFRVGGCVGLAFRPRLSLSLSGGRSQLRKGGRPALEIAMRVPSGGTNLRASSFSLPAALQFNAAGLRAICARVAAESGDCPKGARVGTGSARSPILSTPFRGAIYVVQPRDDGTPDLWAVLAGGGVEVALRIETAEGKSGFRTSMRGLPDIPLESFAIRFDSGKRGLIELRHDVCRRAGPGLFAPAKLQGQNGATLQVRVPLTTGAGCGHE